MEALIEEVETLDIASIAIADISDSEIRVYQEDQVVIDKISINFDYEL